jgi:hypothetical protein
MAKTARSESKTHRTEATDATRESLRPRPTEEEIAVRAYHIYLERGEREGNPADDWLRAERELTEGR